MSELDILNTLTIEQKIIDFMAINKIQLEFIKKIEGLQIDRFFYKIVNNAKINKINSLIDELQLYINCNKILLTVENLEGCIVFELQKENRKILYFDELKDEKKESLTASIGLDNNLEEVSIDITKTPHLLIAGATGAGKSCIINNIIHSIINKYDKDYVKIILCDVKKVEFTEYNNNDHLATNILINCNDIFTILSKMCVIMDNRYNTLSNKGYKNIVEYNEKEQEKLFYYMIVIDEMSDLLMQNKEIEQIIVRLAQLGRACGIHLILATQRPSSDVITSLIKANVPTRLALTVTSYYDSKIIIDQKGAEKLTGKGDFLLKYANGEIVRGQAALIRKI